MNPRNVKAMESRYMSQKMMLRGDSCIEHSNDFNRMLEIHKKTKMQNGFCTPHPEDNSREEPRQPNGINGNISASKLLNAHMGQTNSTYQANRPHSQPPMAVTPSFQKQPRSSAMQPITERSQRSTQGHGVNSVTAMVSWNQPPATPNDNSKSAIVSYPSTLVEKKRTGTPNLFSQRSNGDDKMMSQKHKDASEVQQISFTKPEGGARKPKGVASVELLTHRLGKLCIYGRNNKSKNALVPHRGNNAIIPFEPIKKRKPRPKVDLDPETDRLWRLLMGKEGSEDTETLDKDKEKWWEDERRVFRGRADSFIACMHLVKGDRLFSRWKGSVVDSVIGVFLTQNVSDHLSRQNSRCCESSAFMSLAAKFALKSTSTNEIPSQDGTRVFVEEPTEAVPPSDTMITHSKIGRQPVFNPSSFASCESYGHTRHHNISSTKSAAYEHNRTSEEVILSQDSLDSCTIQAVDEIRSGSGSNSEAEDQTVGFETIKEPSPVKSMQPERVSVFKEFFNHVSRAPPVNDRLQYTHHLLKAPKQIPTTSGVDISMSLRNAGSPVFGLLRGESISSLKSGIADRYDTSYLASRLQVLPQVPQYDFLGNHQNNLVRGSHTGRIYSKDLAHPHDVRYKISDRNIYCREGNHDAVPGCVVARQHLGPKRKRPRDESIDRDDDSDEQIDKFCEEGASGSGTIREEEDANDPFNGLSDGEKFNQVHREVKDIKRELTGVKKTLEDLVKFLDPTPRK